jgi:hypothetical protein
LPMPLVPPMTSTYCPARVNRSWESMTNFT